MSLFARFVAFVASLLPAPRVICSLDGVSPYLSRYYILGAPKMPDGSSPFDRFGTPRKGAIWNDGPGLYLHRFHRSDEEPELHNHPFEQSASLVLVGGYTEERLVGTDVVRRELRPGQVNVIGHDTFHRVELTNGEAWSLFAVTRKTQSWGFLDVRRALRGGYTSYRDFFDRRARERRAATHCPKCGEAFAAHERPSEWSVRNIDPGLVDRRCSACYRDERQDQLEKRFASATKVTLAEFEASRGERGLVADGEDRVLLPETFQGTIAGRYDHDDLRGGAMVLRDGTRFLWIAEPYRAAVDLREECTGTWLSDHHEEARDQVRDEPLAAAQKLVDEALADVVSFAAPVPAVAVVLPESTVGS